MQDKVTQELKGLDWKNNTTERLKAEKFFLQWWQ